MQQVATGISAMLALVLLVAAALGPLGFGLIRFHLNRNAIVQYQGNEVVMIIVAFSLLFAGWLWWKETALAPAVSVGLALFVMYTMVTVVTPQEFEQFPAGNVEKYFLLYFALTGLAAALVMISINDLFKVDFLVTDRVRTATEWVLGLQAGLFFLLWMAQILGVYRNGMTADVQESRALFWLIKYLDLGFAIPIAFTTVLLLRNHQPFGPVLVIAFEGFITVMLIAIAAMALAQWMEGETGGSLAVSIGMALLAIAPAIVWWKWTAIFRGG